MALLEQWRSKAYDETANKGDLQRMWTAYFQEERDIYAELLKNPEPEIILESNWGLSVLPILAFFKNNTLFDSLKLAYNQALRYN